MSDVATPVNPQRDAVEDLVCDLPGGRPDELSFDSPWEIRAFALAVTAHKAGHYQWEQFQGALIDSIAEWDSRATRLDDESWSYYEHWVAALERVLADSGALDAATLADRTADVLATPPNRNHHRAVLEPVAVDPRRAA
ncbi:nitrile hydratase accessory protein [Williamsia sterculiae]|uniref:Nitrile hydratase n=1 Tax=Williamsia sterculiae TaxID=1344003 RepID=A0A1N7H1U8_9NOCA|nr:nitrile hydratase accessory protein [Williamsia sterculiae]SIS18827.1 nitrile hydratase [Williamsia sterculiae]